MSGEICDVCQATGAVVVSSQIAAMSIAKCLSCMHEGLEPYSNWLALFFTLPPEEHRRPDYQDFLAKSLEKMGKTRQEFESDLRELNESLEESSGWDSN